MRCVRVALVLAVASLAVTMVMAQEKEKKAKLSPTSSVMLRIERFRAALEKLDLTEDQKEKIKKVREDNAPKMKEIWGKIHDVLTEEQKKDVEEAMKSAKGAGKKGREFFQSVEAAAKLTDEQKDKIAKIVPDLRALHKEAVGKIREILTDEQKKKLDELVPAKGRKKSES